MFHWFRKLFFKKKKVNAKDITKYRGYGSSRQAYDSSTDTWFYLYLLSATDSSGCSVELDKSNYVGDSCRDLDTTSNTVSTTSYSDSSYSDSSCSGSSSSYDSSSSSSYDSGGSSSWD